MGEECYICGRKDLNLVNAIVDNEVKKVCGFCAAVDDSIILVNKPNENQLKEAERPFTVYERLRRMSKVMLHQDELDVRDSERRKEAQINLAKLAAVQGDKDFMKKQEERKDLHLSEDFNEQIQKARNLKGLSQKQLADAIAESEDSVRLLERGVMPQNSDNAIKKVEQYLRVDLRKKPEEKKSTDAKSGTINIGDIRKMRDEMFGRD